MTDRKVRTARALALIGAAGGSIALVGRSAGAAGGGEAQTCVAAFEDAQRFRVDEHFRAARDALVACSRSVCPKVVADKCKKWKDVVESSMPTFAVSIVDANGAKVSGATLSVDGKGVTLEDDGTLATDPGSHTVRAEKEGFKPAETRVDAKTGEKRHDLKITLDRVAPPPPVTSASSEPAPFTIPPGSYVLAGIGVASLGAFAYFGLSGKSRESDLESSCSPACSPDSVSSVRTKYIAADVALGMAVVSFGVATWLAIASQPSEDKGSTTAASIGIGPRGVALCGSF